MVYEKLLAIQRELKAPKNQYNSFGKYNYRSCEDILTAVKPLLAENKLTLRLSDKVVCIGERYYVEAHAVLTDYTDGTDVQSCAYAREDESKKGMDGSQITGTASSYARKYALNGLFLIDDTEDADTEAHRRQMDNADKAEKKKPAPELRCNDCHEIIKGYTSSKGNEVSAEQWAGKAIEMYGVPLCVACAKDRKEAKVDVIDNTGYEGLYKALPLW